MWKLRSALGLFCFVLLCSSGTLVAGQRSRNSRTWQTLSGNAPLVVARGGISGLFPDSSDLSYSAAVHLSLQNVHIWCDVQLTSDAGGICFPDVKLENASTIDLVYPNRRRTYLVNGASVQGWFSLDFALRELVLPVSLKQRVFTRAPNFDNGLPILTVEDVYDLLPRRSPAGLWLSIPYDAFYSQHNLSMRRFVLDVLSRNRSVNYISSPEVGFLRSIPSRIVRPTKLVFQFLDTDDVEPTTNQTYGSLLNNLTLIRTFAAGILVPKSYIWPVDSLYLLNYTSLVRDAHRAGLEVFASGFANDAVLSYDYSYDPVSEYLSFIDNGQFSVDGVLSDFPVTPSATIDCFAHLGRNDTVLVNVTVISHEGASGDYPGCTDVAYRKAVSDGVDILDCPVQMTSDGIPFCLGSINLVDRTDATQSEFQNRATNSQELNITNGVLAYNLTWGEMQALRPNMFNPYGASFGLFRNPRGRNQGRFMRLSDFLAYANNQSSVSGVLIGIENAAYLANQGLGVTDAVLNALSEAGYNQSTTKRVMIRSTESAVLKRLKSSSNYELVFVVVEDIRDVSNSTILEIKSFASSVVVSKGSVFPTESSFVVGETNVVSKLQSFDLQVYVEIFQNEYVSQPWDFLSDPNMELNTHISAKGMDGVITDFPATAVRYKRNRCLRYRTTPPYMAPIQPANLLQLMAPEQLPPAEAPNPILMDGNVTESPLPSVVPRAPPRKVPAPGPTPPPSGQQALVASTILSGVAILLLLVAFVL